MAFDVTSSTLVDNLFSNDTFDFSEVQDLANETRDNLVNMIDGTIPFDIDDVRESLDCLSVLALFCNEMGYNDVTDFDSVIDALVSIQGEYSGFIKADTYTIAEWAETNVSDNYSLDLPNFLVVDWHATADNLSDDWTSVTLSEEDFYLLP